MSKFLDGAKKGIPITFGYIPMGIGYAAIAIKAGMTLKASVTLSARFEGDAIPSIISFPPGFKRSFAFFTAAVISM